MLRSVSDINLRLIDEQIRQKNKEYKVALQEKAKKYGYIDHKTQQQVVDGEYVIDCPEDWDERTMGTWAHSFKEDDYFCGDFPKPPPLRRSEPTHRVAIFNNYYANSFRFLLHARQRINELEANDVDIENATIVMQHIPTMNADMTKEVLDCTGSYRIPVHISRPLPLRRTATI